ncbi:hypothetical protein DEO72_LG9g2099 [Vigna unguiculata]|uniref:Uncharacterized protein n=1 Tax=Vigna unguiculata TaxID=3917 RepID=A0A4D6MZY7_VIGUN|nr:hypothetical protein DEO72_LG9g2098 [Vigna unguiculata]QCE07083.1 hypothetical protein DEO72_LG9g2099 [Vigna unguiculata]
MESNFTDVDKHCYICNTMTRYQFSIIHLKDEITTFPGKCEPLCIGRFYSRIMTDEPLSRGPKRHFTIGLTPLQVRASHLHLPADIGDYLRQ